MTKVLWRVGRVLVVVAAALAAGLFGPPAGAQEEKKLEDAPAAGAAPEDDLAAETAYLQAYFAEKEKRDFAGAEKAYAVVAARKGASREIVGRALLGRARCLRALKRDAEADAVVAEVGEGYADVVSAGDLAVLRPSRAELTDLDSRIDMLISLGNMEEIAEYGDRAVPCVEPELRSDVPGIVRNAATSLRLIASPAAWATVRRALADPRVAFPRQLASAAFLAGDLVDPKPAHLDALRAALAHEDPDVRWPAIQCALSGDGRVPGDVIDAILSDPVHAELVLDAKVAGGERWGQCLVAAIASSRPELRNRALGHVKAWTSENTGHVYDTSKHYTPFFDPPAAFLADDEALAVVIDRVYRPVTASTARPSRALLDRLSKFPDGADLAATWMLAAPTAPEPFDPTAFAVALTHSRPGKRVWINEILLYDRLVEVASGPGRDKVVEVMGRHWPWGPIVGDVLKGLESRKVLDAPTLRHLARAASDAQSRTAVLRWLGEGGAANVADASGVRVRDEILVGAVEDPDPKVAAAALDALRVLMAQGVRLTFPTESVRRLLEGKDDELASAAAASLASRGEEGLAALAAQLRPDHPRLWALVFHLGDSKDPRVDEYLGGMVLSGSNAHAAVFYAVRKRDGAAELFEKGLASSSSAAQRAILSALRRSPRQVGPANAARLLKLGFERAPGTMSLPVASAFSATRAHDVQAQAARDEVLGGLALAQQLDVLRAALRSTAATDRRWAAWAMAESGGDAGWDDLLAAAEDPDGEVRELAREGLRKLEDSRAELARLRSAGSARKIRERVDALLADAKPDSRRAAIAAIVATRSADRIPDLLRLAVEDEDHGVRSDARTALMSLGSSGATAAPTRETAAPGEK